MAALNAAGFAELVKEPLRVVDGLFTRAVVAAGGAGRVPAEWGEKEHFIRALGLEDEETFARLPCLNDVQVAGAIPPHSLVRYRGMVQDVFEPEIYAAVFEEQASGAAEGAPARLVTTKYRECVEPAPGCHLAEVGREGLGQRGACYLVPLPGETGWARARSAADTAAAVGAWLPGASQTGDLPATPPPSAPKRGRDADVEMTQEPPEPPEPVARRESRRARSSQTVQQPQQGLGQGLQSANEFGLNFPLPQEERRGQGSSTACIVKLYDGDMEALKLQEAVEVLGVLCVNPELADLNASPLGEGLGRDARQPSSALVPRLHALVVRQLPFQHPLLPFSPNWLSEARLVAAYQSCLGGPGELAAARARALEQLQRHLGGDAVAAEYLLMLLVSRSFGKHGDQVLGSWSLNLASWPDGVSARGLAEASAELLPRTVYLSVTAETLNTQRWRPSKDFVANRLVAGQLQLAAGSLLVLDETQMAEGQVSAEGVSACAAISSLVLDQLLVCDFQSYPVKVPLELYCLLVSKQRSIIKDVNVTMPLRPTAAVASEAKPSEPGSLDAARFLLGVVTRRPRPVNISDEVGQIFSRDFASVRQQLQVRPELCHAWMSLARARCLTYAEEDLSVARWKEVLQLEQERLLRCAPSGWA